MGEDHLPLPCMSSDGVIELPLSLGLNIEDLDCNVINVSPPYPMTIKHITIPAVKLNKQKSITRTSAMLLPI